MSKRLSYGLWLPLIFVLPPSHAMATPAALYGTSCAVAGANSTTGPDATANNFICDSGTITWKYPIYQFGSTAASCAAGLAGGLQWTGSALQLCNGTTWGTLGFANNGINLGTSITAANPQISGDATSGLFTPTGSTVAITTNGAERLRVASDGSVAIGTTTANAKLQVNGTVIVANGGETCDATHAGGIRYNSGTSNMEYCNGLAWTPFKSTGGPTGSGYFIVTDGLWNGCMGAPFSQETHVGATATVTTFNSHYLSTGASLTISGAVPADYNGTFTITKTGSNTFTYLMLSTPASNATTVGRYCNGAGGLTAANSVCLTELTTNTNWFGYKQANAAGLLTSGHVKAFLCDGTTCNNMNASTTYYFGSIADSTAGGSSMTSDASGLGPNDSANWANGGWFASSYGCAVGGSCRMWTGRGTGSGTKWSGSSATNTCAGWTTTVGNGETGNDATGTNRWAYFADSCLGEALICLVNP